MDFWAHASDSLGDNLDILGAVASDVVDNINPFSEQFASGNAHATAAEVERQRALEEGRDVDPARIAASAGGGIETIYEGVTATGSDVKAAAGEALSTAGKAAGGLLDTLSNPYVIGGVAVVVVAILAAPYVVPAVKAVVS